VTPGDLSEVGQVRAQLESKEKALAAGLQRLERLAEKVGGEHRLSPFDRQMFGQIRDRLASIRHLLEKGPPDE